MLCCITCHVMLPVMLYNITFMLYNMLCCVIFMLCYITCNVMLRYITYYVSFLLRYITCCVMFILRYRTCTVYVILYNMLYLCYITCYFI